MTNPDAAFSVRHQGDVHVVRFAREIFNAGQVEAARHELRALIEAAPAAPKLVLDMSDVRFVSSVFLGALMELSLKVARQGGELRMCCMASAVAEVFALMHLDRSVRVFPGAAEAVRSFDAPAGGADGSPG